MLHRLAETLHLVRLMTDNPGCSNLGRWAKLRNCLVIHTKVQIPEHPLRVSADTIVDEHLRLDPYPILAPSDPES